MLSVFGGKITTYRKLAEHALEKLKPFFPAMTGAWTAAGPLPGGDMPGADFERFLAQLQTTQPWLPEDLAHHYARLYGTRTTDLLNGARDLAGLGQHFGGLLYQAEIDYLRKAEWARTAEDVLDRRTKHGLHITPGQRAAVQRFMGA
jgi:glycerol-3-phosphate dehydrogenase